MFNCFWQLVSTRAENETHLLRRGFEGQETPNPKPHLQTHNSPYRFLHNLHIRHSSKSTKPTGDFCFMIELN